VYGEGVDYRKVVCGSGIGQKCRVDHINLVDDIEVTKGHKVRNVVQ